MAEYYPKDRNNRIFGKEGLGRYYDLARADATEKEIADIINAQAPNLGLDEAEAIARKVIDGQARVDALNARQQLDSGEGFELDKAKLFGEPLTGKEYVNNPYLFGDEPLGRRFRHVIEITDPDSGESRLVYVDSASRKTVQQLILAGTNVFNKLSGDPNYPEWGAISPIIRIISLERRY